MTQGFFQFNNTIINETLNFTTSTFDLFFINGQKGSGKSEAINKLLEELSEKNLIFQHFCFDNTVINDFLLNFYDSLRNFSLAKKISLKKFTTDNFQEKISHYFKTLEIPSIIIVENFECVENNSDIVNFLSHIGSFENVKIIIISRNSVNLFRFKQLKIKTYEIKPITKEEFREKFIVLSKPIENEEDEEYFSKFFEATQGLDLFLKMSAKFAATTDVDLMGLFKEYERKNLVAYISYEDFLISKFISLIPKTYLSFFKTLCLFSHPISKEFILNYELGDINYLDYFAKNMLISTFGDEIYVKDYFKKYIFSSLSIQEKISKYKELIKIYEIELTKSPKDRLLRLSRESIRKEIDLFNSLTPLINSNKSDSLPYIVGFNSILGTKKKSKLAEKLEKIKERKKQLSQTQGISLNRINLEEQRQKEILEQEKETNRQFIIKLINNSRNLTKNYKYKDAIEELNRAQQTDYEQEFAIEILILLAKNHELLNSLDLAVKCYFEALKISVKTKDSRKVELEFLIASMNKKLYKTQIAQTQFEQIAYDDKNHPKYRAKAFIELGEIYYTNSKNTKDAIKQYERAINLVLGKDKELACSAYYRLAVLYDENNDFENAIKYYQKNYLTSSELKENKYYSISLTNLAQIYIEMSKNKEAAHFLKLALAFDSENNDLENMYFSQKELAKLYSSNDSNSAIGYYKQALESARKLKDDFKEALVFFEVGEFYYDKQEDEKALINFINAKHILKDTSQSENLSIVLERINDLKMRMNNTIFKVVIDKYDKK